jgi:hypothetical protein
MRFLDPNSISQIAPIVLQTLQLPSMPKANIGRYRQKILTSMCRELEKLVRVGKSRRAQDNAAELGLGDLSSYAWDDRQKLAGKYKEGFHFEHTVTVGEMVTTLLALSEPTIVAVEQILATARVTWVTKEENQRLDDLGYRSKRPDWRKAYADSRITLIDD